MFHLVPEHERLNLMPKYLKHPSLLIAFEASVYEFAHDLLGDKYHGGYWDFYDNGETFFFAPPGDGPFYLTSPNYAEGDLDKQEAGMVITSFALSHLSFYAYEKGIKSSKIGDIYRALVAQFGHCKHAQLMFALID